MEKIGIDEIKSLDTQMLGLYEPYHGEIDEDQKFHELAFKNELGLPDEFKQFGIVVNTARELVDRNVERINMIHARVSVNKHGTADIDERRAETQRMFYTGFIYQTRTQKGIHIHSDWWQGAKYYIVHGLAPFEIFYDADRWLDKPLQRKDESSDDYGKRLAEWGYESSMSIPITINAIHPKHILPDPSGRFVIKHRKVKAFDIMRGSPKAWAVPDSIRSGEWDKEIDCISYFDDKYRCELIDGEPVLKGKVIPHRYGFIPYVLIDSGLGNINSKGDVKERYVGVLRYNREMLKAESRSYSERDIILLKAAWPWMTAQGPGAENLLKLDQRLGTVTMIPEGVELKERSPQIPPDALTSHQLLTQDMISGPAVLSGGAQTGMRSAADRRLATAEASTRYAYPIQAFSDGTAKLLMMAARLYKNVVPGDVRMWSKSPASENDVITIINKDDLREPLTCHVEFAPISEEDEYRRHVDLEQLYKTGIYSRGEVLRKMPNVDPKRIERELEEERFNNNPLLNDAMAQLQAQKFIAGVYGKTGMNVGPPEEKPPGEPGRPVPGSPEEVAGEAAAMNVQPSLQPTQGMGGGGFRG